MLNIAEQRKRPGLPWRRSAISTKRMPVISGRRLTSWPRTPPALYGNPDRRRSAVFHRNLADRAARRASRDSDSAADVRRPPVCASQTRPPVCDSHSTSVATSLHQHAICKKIRSRKPRTHQLPRECPGTGRSFDLIFRAPRHAASSTCSTQISSACPARCP